MTITNTGENVKQLNAQTLQAGMKNEGEGLVVSLYINIYYNLTISQYAICPR